MTRRLPRRPTGRRTSLTPEVQKRLLDLLRAGVPIAHAGPASGVTAATVHNWIRRGEDAAADYEAGLTVPASEQLFRAFFEEAARARAEGVARAVANVRKAGAGGYIVRELERSYRNADGQLVTEREVFRAPPEWRAEAWFLERAARDAFGKTIAEVQLSGPGGGPIEVTAGEFEGMASRLRVNMARVAGELMAGPVIEGELDREAG